MALTATPDIAGLSVSNQPLSQEELRKMNAYWRAANYLSVGQIYLYDNPLLKEPLKLEHVKPRLLGHWGTTGAQPDLRAPQPRHPEAQSQYDVRDWPWSWRARHCGEYIPGGHLQRVLSEYQPRHRRP